MLPVTISSGKFQSTFIQFLTKKMKKGYCKQFLRRKKKNGIDYRQTEERERERERMLVEFWDCGNITLCMRERETDYIGGNSTVIGPVRNPIVFVI